MTETDLQFLLIDYADRNSTAFIERDVFFKELASQALYKAQKDRRWEVWTKRPREKFDIELSALIESGVCSVQKNGGIEYLYMPSFFVERVRSAWEKIDQQVSNIFPSEKKIKISTPPDIIKIYSTTDFIKLLRDPQTSDLPLIQLNFTKTLGSTIMLASFSEARLLDAALSKIRRALMIKEIRGFCLKRMRSVFPDRFMQANTIIDLIVKNPIGCTIYLRGGDENAFMIWIKLCEFIKESAQSETTPPTEADFAVQQAAEIIGVYNSFYRSIAAEKNEKENRLLEMYEHISEPPYFWTLTDIYKITGKNGKPVIDSIRHEEISDFILKRTYDTGDSIVQPPLLVFYDEYKEKCFAKKELVFTAFGALITASRKEIAEAIRRRWHKIIRDYSMEAAMKSDMAFETLLIKEVKSIKPFVLILHQDTKLRLLRKEFSANDNTRDSIEKYFHGGELKSLTALYALNRKNILTDIKLGLPFWYSIPLLVAIIRIFRGQTRDICDDDE
ncbi:MAG: hypothetical protein LBC77_03970 [Spirochaetaceae bacterium]|jgi:hypothetical protein|nr:hypothetical protein [Spirochaetaceae bacterium]